MLNKIKLFGMLLVVIILSSFVDDTPYDEKIKSWQQKRVEALKAEDGWLNLAGLFWLEEGENTIGGAQKNSIHFPAEHSAEFLGKIILKDGKVTYEANPNTQIFLGSEVVKTAELFPYKGKPTILSYKSLRWFIIQRGDKYAIRLRDLEGEYLKNFKGIKTFPIDKKWLVKAKFIPTEGKKLKITDITGRSYEQDSPGKLVFTIGEKEYSLDATGNREHLHFVFGDATNKHETYGGGRFLDAETPDADGNIYLDFNKAYNPPCAFTPYATCPLPTKDNILAVSITAGEKYHGNH